MIEFILNEKEAKLAKEFECKHLHPNVNKGSIGGHIEYTFTLTSIGTVCIITCVLCGETKNITDYDSW